MQEDVCLAGAPALNGVCGDLDCVCLPRLQPHKTRLRITSGEHAPLIGLFIHAFELHGCSYAAVRINGTDHHFEYSDLCLADPVRRAVA